MLIAWNFWDSISNGLTGLSLMIDGIVYWLVSILFDLYEELAGFQFLTENAYNEIVDRFYIIIGVVMLFYLAYALLKALVNPDELTKSTSKIVMNIVVSLVLLNIIPIIFTYAYKLQHVIISEDKIVSSIVLGKADENISTVGRDTAMIFLESFLKPAANAEIEGYANWTSLKTCILDNTYQDENGNRGNGNEGFRHITLLADSITAGDTEYTFIISTLCGAFLIYVIASFCLDLGVRVVKLAFYQIISPIPILMRIIPEKKSVFDNWVKATLATYLEVFIRLFVIYLITYLCTIIPDVIEASFETNPDLGLFATVVVLMGVFAFAKQAPKLIGDVIGVNAGNLKLGIKDKLATGGAFMAASALGGGATTGIRNLTHGIQNIAKAKGFGNKALAALRTVGSTGTGMISGAARGGYGARGAKTYADVKKYAGEGAAAAIKKRDERETYKASHSGPLGVTRGHIEDMYQSAVEWAGVELGTEAIKKELDVYTEGAGYKKKLEDLALKKSTKAKLYSQQIDALNQETIDRNVIKKQVEQNIRSKHNVNSYRNAAMRSLNRAHYRSVEEYNAAVEHKAQLSYAAALQKDLNDNLNSETNKLYNQQMEERANQIDQLKRAKNYEVMKVVNEKLAKGNDAEFQEIVNSFKTFKKKNASYEDIVNLGDLTAAGWDSSWDTIDPMTLTKDDFDEMKKKVTYTNNHDSLDKKKKATAARYAERIQKEQEKK